MDAKRLKLADLDINQSYYVVGYKPIKTKYGNTYILQCTPVGEDDQPEFEMFATKLIASYISTYSPADKFLFTVRKNSNYTYAEIPGYNPSGGNFIRLN